MSFELLDKLSLPGDPQKPNEDAFAQDARAAVVLDGATPLGPSLLPGPSDAQWIAQFGARRLMAHLQDAPPQEALTLALGDAEKSFAGLRRHPIREKWQTPCASMMLVCDPLRLSLATRAGALPAPGTSPASADARGGGGPELGSLQFFWFGDCAALVEQEGEVIVVGETLQKRQEEAARAKMVAGMAKISSASGINRPEIEPLLRAARNRINSGKNWLFSPDARAAAHVEHKTLEVKPGAKLLLASDGFLALVSDYGRYTLAGLMDAAGMKGLAALGEELRVLEGEDRLGEKYPRFKTSDDATAILLRVG